jgi:hypothetical protein
MKASELRIGNIVRYGANNRVLDAELFLQLLKYTTPFDPIPLTEEWKLKFGFKKTEWDNFNSYRLMIGNNDYTIVLYSDGNCEVGDIITCKIEYVHQLQNLYFALTGEELKQQEPNISEWNGPYAH